VRGGAQTGCADAGADGVSGLSRSADPG